jgi:hypothetical protein
VQTKLARISFQLPKHVVSYCLGTVAVTATLGVSQSSLKAIISLLSETMLESASFTIPFYSNPLTPHVGSIQTVVTIATITENVHMSMSWKGELVAYGSRKQPLPRITHLMPLKPNHSSICLVCPDSVWHLVLNSESCSYQTMHRNRPCE